MSQCYQPDVRGTLELLTCQASSQELHSTSPIYHEAGQIRIVSATLLIPNIPLSPREEPTPSLRCPRQSLCFHTILPPYHFIFEAYWFLNTHHSASQLVFSTNYSTLIGLTSVIAQRFLYILLISRLFQGYLFYLELRWLFFLFLKVKIWDFERVLKKCLLGVVFFFSFLGREEWILVRGLVGIYY